jgi:hypothetical protein
VLRLLSGCRHAHAESAVVSASMRWLWRADLGSEEIAYRTAQNLYSLHRSVRVTDPPKVGASNISTVMPRAMSALPGHLGSRLECPLCTNSARASAPN